MQLLIGHGQVPTIMPEASKNNGFTTICKASENALVKSLYEAGELPGALWKQGLLMGV